VRTRQLQALQDGLECLPPYAPRTLLRVYRQMRRAQEETTYPHIDVPTDTPEDARLPDTLLTAMHEADAYIAQVQTFTQKFDKLKPVPITVQDPGFGL
jgi:hypothetical protein